LEILGRMSLIGINQYFTDYIQVNLKFHNLHYVKLKEARKGH